MKRTLPLAALVAFASVLMLSSCDAMFDTNLFKAANWGQFVVDKSSLSTPQDIESQIENSPTFYDQLRADQSLRDAALTTLVGDPNNPVPSSDPLVNVLAASIYINTSAAGDVAANLPQTVDYLTGLQNQSPTPPPEEILSEAMSLILPDTANPTKPGASYTEFSDILSAFSKASILLSQVPVSSSTDGTGTTTYTMQAFPGGSDKDTAMYGLLSVGLSGIDTNQTGGDRTQALWDAIQTGSTAGIQLSSSVYDSATSQPSQEITDLLNVLGLNF